MSPALAAKVLLTCSTVLVVVGSFTGSPVTLAVGATAAVFALVAIQRDHEAQEAGR